MPQRKQLTWAQLRVGVLVISGLVVLGVGIFFISGQVGFLTHRITRSRPIFRAPAVCVTAPRCVWRESRSGNVEGIHISKYTDPSKAVEIDMKIASKYQDQIRTDSVATIETVGLLGESYVDITRGGP